MLRRWYKIVLGQSASESSSLSITGGLKQRLDSHLLDTLKWWSACIDNGLVFLPVPFNSTILCLSSFMTSCTWDGLFLCWFCLGGGFRDGVVSLSFLDCLQLTDRVGQSVKEEKLICLESESNRKTFQLFYCLTIYSFSSVVRSTSYCGNVPLYHQK